MKKRAFDTRLILKIRAILDAKYYEYLYKSSNPESVQNFAEYAWWWLGEYDINKTTSQVIQNKSSLDEDYFRLE